MTFVIFGLKNIDELFKCDLCSIEIIFSSQVFTASLPIKSIGFQIYMGPQEINCYFPDMETEA